MNTKQLSLTVALGLAVGLSACQDQTVVAPDEEVVSPDHLEVTAKKGGNNNPVTKEVNFLLGFTQFEPKEWDVGAYDDLWLALSVYNQSFESSLTNTYLSAAGDAGNPTAPPENGIYGDCIYDPADTPDNIIIALAEELDGDRVYPWEIDPYVFPHLILEIDRTTVNTGEGSEDNRFQFGYSSNNPELEVWSKKKKRDEPGTVAIRVGSVLRMGTFGHPTVGMGVMGDEEHFTFSGGTVSVVYFEGRPKPRLECPLLDPVKVSVKLN